MDGKTFVFIEIGDGYMTIKSEGHNKDPLICCAISVTMQNCANSLKDLAIGRESDIIVIEKEI